MRCMVKLNDLEELAKLPLGGTPGASTSAPPQEEAINLDGEAGRMMEVKDKAQLSSGEDNFSFM